MINPLKSHLISKIIALRPIRFKLFVTFAMLSLFACSSSVKVGPSSVAGLTPDARVSMDQVQVAYIGNAGGGTGTLFYRGGAYPFKVGGLGVGGIGASTVDAEGEVYKLASLASFPGTYGEASYGFVFGTKSAGDLWLQNETGVIMHLKAKRTGLMLSLGGDAVVISMSAARQPPISPVTVQASQLTARLPILQ